MVSRNQERMGNGIDMQYKMYCDKKTFFREDQKRKC